MKDKLLIIDKIKKTITYIENSIYNYPHKYIVLKNNISTTLYDILELSYKANIYQDVNYMKDLIIKIRILEYYIKKSNDLKLISYKKFYNIGSFLLEIIKMTNAWIKYATSK